MLMVSPQSYIPYQTYCMGATTLSRVLVIGGEGCEFHLCVIDTIIDVVAYHSEKAPFLFL